VATGALRVGAGGARRALVPDVRDCRRAGRRRGSRLARRV